jgi:hypothetical protein
VRRKPFSVVLFDEVEKAHPDIFNSLLQILEEGRLTDGQGRVVDFKNTVIIMTTNLGTKRHRQGRQPRLHPDRRRGRLRADEDQGARGAEAALPPEFLNRVDEIIVFPQLSQEQIISDGRQLMIAAVGSGSRTSDMEHRAHRAAKHLLAKRGFDPVLGARPLRRTVQREIEDVLAEKILYRRGRPGQIVLVDVEGEEPNQTFTFKGEKVSTLPDMPPFETADLGTDPLAELAADGSEDGPRDVPRAGGESSPVRRRPLRRRNGARDRPPPPPSRGVTKIGRGGHKLSREGVARRRCALFRLVHLDHQPIADQAGERAFTLLGRRPGHVEQWLGHAAGRFSQHGQEPTAALTVGPGVGLAAPRRAVVRGYPSPRQTHHCATGQLSQDGERAVQTSAPSSITATDQVAAMPGSAGSNRHASSRSCE